MSDRISDEQLQLYLDQLESLRKRNPGEWMHKAPWRMALEEIRARREQDLTDEEMEALRYAQDVLRGERFVLAADHARQAAAAWSVLNKLTRGNR